VSQWLCLIRPPRGSFMDDATPAEQDVMREHFAYLESLLDAGS
jgi:hypothetical protein